ncbi:MAG: 5'-nucleotidase [Bacteroidales bacterium]|nr:5'-nucleotidase [Bacteroidales bacterium]
MHKTLSKHILLLLTALLLFSCAGREKNNLEYSFASTLLSVNSENGEEDSVILAIIEPYKEQLQFEMNDVIGYSEAEYFKSIPEGHLNNLIADIILEETRQYFLESDTNIRLDICLLNMGGIRSTLQSGNITRSNIYEIMPFNNAITVLTLDFDKMNQLFHQIALDGGMPISGAKLGIRNNEAVNILINGIPFENTNSTYNVVTSDYLANGGDHLVFFENPISTLETTYYVRDAIINYILKITEAGEKIYVELDNRIYFE